MQLANAIQNLWATVPEPARDWAARNYISGIKIALIIVLATVFNRYSGRILRRFISRTVRPDLYPIAADRKKRLDTLNSITLAVAHFAVWSVVFILILGLFGINTGPLFAGAGLVGAGLAFGSQSLIKDFLSGIFIISENQYRVGDTIKINGVSGIVQAIGLRTTVLRDISGSVHHVPNGSIVVTTNKTMGNAQINLDVSVANTTDVALLEHVINHAGEVVANKADYKEDIIQAPYFDRISDYSGTAITVKVICKTVGGRQLQVKSALLAELKKGFDTNKIKVVTVPASLLKAKK